MYEEMLSRNGSTFQLLAADDCSHLVYWDFFIRPGYFVYTTYLFEFPGELITYLSILNILSDLEIDYRRSEWMDKAVKFIVFFLIFWQKNKFGNIGDLATKLMIF